MNKRIRELAEQTGSTHKQNLGVYQFYTDELEKFAELLIKDCIEAIQNKSMNSNDEWEYGLRMAQGAIQEHFGVEE
jgi:hypothetical protein